MADSSEPCHDLLFEPLVLPCGTVLRNRLAKAAMSDSLGDGRGQPTDAQMRLYQRWAEGGVAFSIIGEVQSRPDVAEKPGNLVLTSDAERERFKALAMQGAIDGAGLWLQLGHAGALAHPPISAPKGPSAIQMPELTCGELTLDEIRELPSTLAATARLAQGLGFGGVQIHAAHGFLLSQFLSPLFNRRQDFYGGMIDGRMRLLLEVTDAVRAAVGPSFPIAVKLNATDQLEGGLVEEEALAVIDALEKTAIDLIDISGGTYFPGAKNASDATSKGPYFVDFARRAKRHTEKPIMVTGGFKTRLQAIDAIASGAADIVGLARALVLDPELPRRWQTTEGGDPIFPTFTSPPKGGVTAWFTMHLTALADDREAEHGVDLEAAIQAYEERDEERTASWRDHFRLAR